LYKENEPKLIDLKSKSEVLVASINEEQERAYQYVSSVLSKALAYEETFEYESARMVLDDDEDDDEDGHDDEDDELSWEQTAYLAPKSTRNTWYRNLRIRYQNLRIQGYNETIDEAYNRIQSLIREIDILNESIEKLISQGNLDRTLEQINNLLRLQPNRKDMIDLKSQLLERYHKLTTVRDESFEKANRLFAQQNYEGCLDELDRIDVSVMNLKSSELRKLADRHKTRLKTLYIWIKERVLSKQLDGLLVDVNELLSLKSDDSRILKLRDQLIERDSKDREKSEMLLVKAISLRDEYHFAEAVVFLGQIDPRFRSKQIEEMITQCKTLAKEADESGRSRRYFNKLMEKLE
jgi:hypothetical protein